MLSSLCLEAFKTVKEGDGEKEPRIKLQIQRHRSDHYDGYRRAYIFS